MNCALQQAGDAQGDLHAAEADFQQAVALAPQDLGNRIAYPYFLSHHARPDDALAQIEAVLTASAPQVRAPVHLQSLGKWHDKVDFLAPLTDALDPALWPGLRQG